jgi:RecA-family ATPase
LRLFVQMIEIATGRRLLGVKLWQPDLTALYINAEDSTVEIYRRVYAACLYYGVAESDLARLCILGADDWRTQQLSFLRAEKATTLLDQGSLDFLDGMLGSVQPDVIVFDPLVALCGGGNMNDNAAMALVMRALKRLANKHRSFEA